MKRNSPVWHLMRKDIARGFVFDGRIAEDFKLSTGTWVSVGPLRIRSILHAAPCVRDLIIAGHHRDEITALILPDPEHYPIDEHIRELLRTSTHQSTGSSTRIIRAIILQEPPSIDTGERFCQPASGAQPKSEPGRYALRVAGSGIGYFVLTATRVNSSSRVTRCCSPDCISFNEYCPAAISSSPRISA